MFVRCKKRSKDGKEHRYWSVVENVRVGAGRVVQRRVLYLGEINDSQRAAWCRSIEVLEGASRSRQVALFPEDREAPELDCEVVQVRLAELTLHDPRQWGACWLALTLWVRLALDRFWGPRLPASRQGTRWLDLLKIQVCYRLIDPGSDWRLHRHWYELNRLRREKLRQVFRREGRYLLRSNMTSEDPAEAWRHSMQFTEIEQAFKELKHHLAIRPIFHQLEERIEAHIFVSFIAYCLLVTLKYLARPQAPGLTPRAILEKFATLQMVDIHVSTTDGRHLMLPRHTQPNREHDLLLRQLQLKLPKQPAPKLLT